MPNGNTSEPSPTLAADEAFGILGNEIRIQILRALATTDAPLSYTALREQVGLQQGSQFNYHLDKVVGHYVENTDDGYVLRQPGRRVVQAVLSGAVTDNPEIEPAPVEFECRHCDAPVEVGYSDGTMHLSCTECSGNYEESVRREQDTGTEYGNLTNMALPPAGVQGRTAKGILRAAATWGHLDAIAAANNVCPRCSARVEFSIQVCENHDATDGLCKQCDHRLAVWVRFRCTNCIYEQGVTAVMALLTVPDLLAFVGKHGFNTTGDGIEWGWEYEEDIRSTDPFEAQFTFTIDGDSLTLTVDEDLSVVDATERSISETV